MDQGGVRLVVVVADALRVVVFKNLQSTLSLNFFAGIGVMTHSFSRSGFILALRINSWRTNKH